MANSVSERRPKPGHTLAQELQADEAPGLLEKARRKGPVKRERKCVRRQEMARHQYSS